MATIQGVYVALFGRPADPTGLSYFNSVTNNGANLNAIGNLAASPEYQARFSGLNNVQIINSIYQSLFGRDADLTGLNFFSNALANGSLNINNIAIAILDGAQGNDRTVSNNKIAAADLYTKALDTGSEVVAYSGLAAAAQGRAFVTGVTTTVPTAAAVDTAVAAMVSASGSGSTGQPGSIITLTAATADVVSPDQTSFALKTTANDDTIRANLTVNALETTDIIDGGAGNDTLNASLNNVSITPVIKNVETLNITDLTAATKSTLDLSASTGVKAVWNSASVGELEISGVNVATTVGVKGAIADDATFTFANVTGSNDTATLAVQEAVLTAGETLSVLGIENLNVVVSNDTTTTGNVSTLGAVVLTNTKSIVVTGEADTLTVGDNAAANFSALTKFDASGLKGNLVLDLATGTDPTEGVAISVSSNGTNTVTLGATAGKADSLVFTSANVSTINKMTTVNGFEFTADKLDVKSFALGADTTVGSTAVTPAGDIAGFFSGTGRVVLNAGTEMVYVDANKDGNFNAGTDLAIKIVGATAANFTAADLTLS
ncbi:DUF4214 domain-containing protein [Rhizobium rhizoryzae]|uniref:DUF4214 domain-containing protein n=1 Tax=Rhizobium rhizoryzae TaxID=451876 RepID=A0A7W6LKM1_9HYPH|nr:DUF4214 domain-containing protein [Rhizobium rhizoryzae]MBB4146124.1 hypothetical protein [Rhizobium rhizoryzae]